MNRLRALERWSERKLDVYWRIESNSYMPEIPTFWSFFRGQSSRKGSGRVALLRICQEYDKLGRPLSLFAVNDKMASYYKEFGFSKIDGPCKDFMVRVPKSIPKEIVIC